MHIGNAGVAGLKDVAQSLTAAGLKQRLVEKDEQLTANAKEMACLNPAA